MHETRFVNEILDALKQNVTKGAISGQTAVNVRLSPFSHVSPGTLRESFNMMASGQNYKNVSLNIFPLELPLECKKCQRSTKITKKVFECPFCGSADIYIQMSKEFYVESITIDKKDKGGKN